MQGNLVFSNFDILSESDNRKYSDNFIFFNLFDAFFSKNVSESNIKHYIPSFIAVRMGYNIQTVGLQHGAVPLI